MKIKNIFAFILLCFCMSSVHAVETQPKEFAEAVEILHTYGGNGSQIQDAIDIANKLADSHPNKGYEQTIYAEIYSTFKLSQSGKPVELRNYIIDITSEAIKLNPKLAQAYVARARTYLRSHELEKARLDVDKALELDPTLSGAAFIKADFYRKTHQIEDAVKWYKNFIELADSTKRKANGYYWIARTYQVIRYHDNKANKHNIERTSKYYRKSLELSPNNP